MPNVQWWLGWRVVWKSREFYVSYPLIYPFLWGDTRHRMTWIYVHIYIYIYINRYLYQTHLHLHRQRLRGNTNPSSLDAGDWLRLELLHLGEFYLPSHCLSWYLSFLAIRKRGETNVPKGHIKLRKVGKMIDARVCRFSVFFKKDYFCVQVFMAFVWMECLLL